MNRQQVSEMWSRYIDGDLDPRESVDLQPPLLADSALRDSALDDCETDGMLRALARSEATSDAFVDGVLSKLAETNERRADPIATPPPVPTKPIVQQTTPPIPPPVATAAPSEQVSSSATQPEFTAQAYAHRTALPWVFAICAALCFALITAAAVVVFVGQVRQPVASDSQETPRSIKRDQIAKDQNRSESLRQQPATVKRPDASLPQEVADDGVLDKLPVDDPSREVVEPPLIVESPPVVERETGDEPMPPENNDGQTAALITFGRIVKQTDAEWDSPPQTELLREPLYLRDGVVEIAMSDGAVIKVQGPAEFNLDSAGRVALKRGRLNAAVPRQAIGFTVAAPSCRIVDLGTEFDVGVENDGATNVKVVRGSVQVTATPKNGKEQNFRLNSGEYKRISADSKSNWDWRLVVEMKKGEFGGTVTLNDEQITFSRPDEFFFAYGRIAAELNRVEPRLPDSRRAVRDNPFHGEVIINDKRMTFDNRTEHSRVRQQTMQQLNAIWLDAFRNSGKPFGAFNGTVIINGEEIRIDGFDDLKKKQEEMFRGLPGNVPVPTENN